MEPLINPEYLLKTFSLLTIIGQALIVVWIAGLALKAIQKRENRITLIVARKGVVFAFIVALAATLGSLSFSELALLNPCKLCWFQRIMMYPQLVIAGLAVRSKKDISNLITAAIILASIGAIIALYHYMEQFGFAPVTLPCSTVGYSISCSNRFEATYGYVTIPLMSLTAFVMILLSLGIRRRN